MAECERCPLGRVGKYVPSDFPKGTNPTGLAFVGEAPAKNEIRQGKPFVGASGHLLNAVLANYGINRNNVFVTNACSCHYPESMNKLPPEAIDACRPRLLRELQDAGVDTVVTMGNSASAPLLPRDETRKGITKLRAGPPKRVTLEDDLNLEVVATFHPAYCLRSQGMFPLMLGDISKAVNKDRPTLWYEPTIVEVKTPTEASKILYEILQLNKGEGIVVDTESGRDKDTSFGRDDGPYGRVLCIGIGPTDPKYQDTVFVFTDDIFTYPTQAVRVKKQLAKTLRECGIIAQNGKYDVGVLMNFLDEEEPFPLVHDTMLSSYACYEVGGIHGLKYMGQEVLGCPDWDSEIKPYITKDEGYGSIPREMLYRYNAFDVHVTRLLYGYFSNLIEERGLSRFNSWLTHRVSPMLTKVESRGMGFDCEEARRTQETLASDIERLEAQLPRFTVTKKKKRVKDKKPYFEYWEEEIQLNPRSPMQVTEWFAQQGIRTPSTDEAHLKVMLDNKRMPDHVKEVIRTLLEVRGVSKLKGTYVDGLLDKVTEAGRIHTSYLIHGTTTGRLSSRGPNLQNVPRKGPIKRQFIPRGRDPISGKGHKHIGLDFAQAELRVLTWLAQDEGMRELFNDPEKDIFRELCRQMIPGFDTLSEEEQKEIRTLIKTFAYGVSYGRTAEGIAADPDFHMTVAQAQAQMDLFNARIPAIKEFQREVVARIHRGEDLINPFGRHRRFYLITDANKNSVENEAMAYLPQSTASDIGLEAACRISDQGIYLVNLVHDALYAEAPEDEVDEVIALMDKIMVETGEEICGGGYVKFKTDAKVGNRWSEV